MIDQAAVIARLCARLERAGRKLYDLTLDEMLDLIDCVFAELVAESPVFPATNS